MKKLTNILAVLLLTLMIVAGAGCYTSPKASITPLPGQNLTPIIGEAIMEPQAVTLSDGKVYLMYELMLTNTTTVDYAINKVVLEDSGNKNKVVGEYSAEDVKEHLIPAKKDGATNVLKARETAVLTFSLPFEAKSVPKIIDHILSVKTDTPFSILPAETDERIARTNVDTTKPVVIGPPFYGENWVACNVSDNYGHRNALFPMNGSWVAPERWAVDYVKLDDENKIVSGDINILNNWPSYNQDLLAVSDGTILKVVDEYENLAIGGVLENMSLENLGGNYVLLDIGNGYSAFYAHMIKGSIKVKKGDKVKRGQVIGKLGNSGNSTGPHLHFHIVNGTDPIAGQGAPYVINSFEVTGQADPAALSDDFFGGAPLETTAEFKGAHKNQMPADMTVVTFKKPAPPKETEKKE